MKGAILRWLERKWEPAAPEPLMEDYLAVFTSPAGKRLLQQWLDNVYCTVYGGQTAEDLWMHNGRRTFVHEILANLEEAERYARSRASREAT